MDLQDKQDEELPYLIFQAQFGFINLEVLAARQHSQKKRLDEIKKTYLPSKSQ